MVPTRTPLILDCLVEASAKVDYRGTQAGARETGKLSKRSQRHLALTAIGLRRLGAFGQASIPGAKRQVRVSGDPAKVAGATGQYIPIEVLRHLTSGGSRRSIPYGKYHFGHRGMPASAAVRFRYGRAGIY